LTFLSRFTAKHNLLTTNKIYWVREQSLPLLLTPLSEFGKYYAWTVIEVVSQINGTPSRSATMHSLLALPDQRRCEDEEEEKKKDEDPTKRVKFLT